jgi:hypothetical protein
MWAQTLYNKCEVPKAPYPGYVFAPKPTKKTLDGFENARHLNLPKSYREFALFFGAGELAGHYRITVPMSGSSDYDLEKFNTDYHGDPDEHLLDQFGSSEVIEKCLFFCSSGGGVVFGWKTDEVTAARGHEYAIYAFDFPPMVKVASTFQKFVETYVMAPDRSRKWVPELTFVPVQIKG